MPRQFLSAQNTVVQNASPTLLWALGRRAMITAAIALTLGMAPPAVAQVLRPELRFPFLADPLQDTPRDPLLPNPTVPRPISPLEQAALVTALDQLALEAAALDQAGELAAARQLWRREVRLRRLLGVEAEIAAIDRVGRILRDRNATPDLQLYALRLNDIRAALAPLEATDPANLALLDRLADTYTVLGAVDAAADIHQELATAALATGDRLEQRRQLEALAVLRADWFEFGPAAVAYGELAALAEAEGNRPAQIRYLDLQVENLDQALDFAAAIAVGQRLLTLSQQEASQWPQIASRQQRLAQHYLALGNLDVAARQYQVAYTNAIDQDQLEVAAAAIAALADIYKTLGRWADVVYLYEQLLLVTRQAHSAYATMTAYDQLGQGHEQLGAIPLALAAYREGLVLARGLGTQQTYFEEQIARLTARPTAPPMAPSTEGAPL